MWLRAPQGSRGAPLICGRALSMAMRMATATVERGVVNAATCVDDPIMSIVGDSAAQHLAVCKIVGSILAMGYQLAFAKAQDSDADFEVTWTSARIQILHKELAVKVEVKAEILAELTEGIDDMFRGNAVAIDALRSLAGRATCVASLLHTWRPFVSMLWAPIFSSKAKCPFDESKIWRKTVEVPLAWMRAFLRGAHGTLQRTYHLAAYLKEGDCIEIVTDASPTGIGAFLRINGTIREFAFDELTSEDEATLSVARGGSEGQQVWEALIVLAALRLWSPHWRSIRATLMVRSDSVSALILVMRLKTSGVGTSLIAREVALDVAEALYEPHVCEHIPGISNIIADHLSRRGLSASSPLPSPFTPCEASTVSSP